eukprot:TRINITY_DN5682_c0_g1_i1.p1 TRINITY_DN5682_c0_g1~~TRINITY_DN5682_c0_g1_i1.p1  ORF type:complete len:684 (-),score=171.65 TRINITY_DN5682_c0_g1_i1:87-2138(-)
METEEQKNATIEWLSDLLQKNDRNIDLLDLDVLNKLMLILHPTFFEDTDDWSYQKFFTCVTELDPNIEIDCNLVNDDFCDTGAIVQVLFGLRNISLEENANEEEEGSEQDSELILQLDTEQKSSEGSPPPVPSAASKPKSNSRPPKPLPKVRNSLPVPETSDLESISGYEVTSEESITPEPEINYDEIEILEQNDCILILQAAFRGKIQRLKYEKMLKFASYRQRVANELLDTERHYVSQLDLFVKLFLLPLREDATKNEKPMLSAEDIKTIFSSIQVIVGFNKVLLSDMEEAIMNWNINIRIGAIFKKMSQYMRVYTEYITNYNHALSTMGKLRSKSKKLDGTLQEIESMPCFNGLKFSSLLIMPVQRVPRYNMLLIDILKHTWKEHPDYDDLEEVSKEIGNVATYLNSKKGEAEQSNRVYEIQDMVAGIDDLTVHTRKYIDEINCLFIDEREKSRKMYLFNDTIMVTRPLKKSLSKKEEKFVAIFDLNDIRISNCPEDHIISIHDKETDEEYYFAFDDIDVKNEWKSLILETKVIFEQNLNSLHRAEGKGSTMNAKKRSKSLRRKSSHKSLKRLSSSENLGKLSLQGAVPIVSPAQTPESSPRNKKERKVKVPHLNLKGLSIGKSKKSKNKRGAPKSARHDREIVQKQTIAQDAVLEEMADRRTRMKRSVSSPDIKVEIQK